MSILYSLAEEAVWQRFYTYKANSGHMNAHDLELLKDYIDSKRYEPVVSRIINGESLSLPHVRKISKSGTNRKRIVFVFPEEEKYVLKLLTFLLIREYDYLFTPNLYSFRANHGVKQAIRFLTGYPDISSMYSYKVDISDYFNSVTNAQIIGALEDLSDDRLLVDFFSNMLSEERSIDGNQIVNIKKGIIAGAPTASFLANIYLRDLDRYFYEQGILYARYSDDIITFAKTEDELTKQIEVIKSVLSAKGLTINKDKEEYSKPHEAWTFLGFMYKDGVIDVSPIAVHKLKRKIYRKSRALMRWKDKRNLTGTNAARALIKRINIKLYDNPNEADLTWSRWFFPSINTTDSLKEIDSYIEDTVRYMVTGKRNKSRFNCRYEDIKALGFRSLVNEYYKPSSIDTSSHLEKS